MSNVDIRLQQGVGFPRFSRGRISFTVVPAVRIFASYPVIVDYLDVYNPSTYTGRLPQTVIQPIDFRAGVLDLYIPQTRDLILTKTPTLFRSGSLRITTGTIPVVGAVTDFAVYPSSVARDPAEFYVTSAPATISGNVGSPWTRPSAIFAVSKGGHGFKKVAYLGVGGRFNGVPADTNQYLGQVQLEKVPAGTTLPLSAGYSKAREVRTTVQPDRLNYSQNPSFEVDTTTWAVTGTGLTLTRTAGSLVPGSWLGRVSVPTATAGTIQHTVIDLIPGRRYIASVFYSSSAPRTLVLGILTGATLVNTGTNPARMWVRFEATSSTVVLTLPLDGVTGATTLDLDGALVEEGEKRSDYFDGGFGPDYLWDTGGDGGKTRSYYYKNRVERNATVKRILENNVPLGIGIAEPRFAQLSEQTVVSTYGGGGYGTGIYG